MSGGARMALRVLLSLGVSGVFIYVSLRHVDLAAVVGTMLAAEPGPIWAYLVMLLAVHVVKALRWQILLHPVGSVTFRRVNQASAVGFLLIVVLPFRLGEIARPLLVSRPSAPGEVPLRRGATLASIVVERIIDSLAMGVLGIVSLRMLATTGKAASYAEYAATLVTIGFAAVCVGLTFAFFNRERAVDLLRRGLSPISKKLALRLARLIDGFILGLHLGSALHVLGVFVLTVVYWGLHAWGFLLVAGAFGLELSLLMACTVLATHVVGMMIPAGPGMVGTSQFFTQLGLSIFIPGALTVPEVVAHTAAYANTIWLLQFGQQAVLGLIVLVVGKVSLSGLFDAWPEEPATEGATGPHTEADAPSSGARG